MKSITIKSLKLTNFKGIKNLEIKEFGKETKIFGDNGTGKTTVFDAFTWLLFGKDSTDRTTFEIKTLDKNNNVIPKIDHEVEAEIEVDFETVNIKRTFREKWVKKKGNLESEFAGNETNYEWNGVPMTQRDFNAKISTIVDEKVFKLITSPSAFNSLKWQDQRQVLIDISGGVTDEAIADGNEDFLKLLSNLTNKSIEEYQKQIKASIAKSKKELKFIPSRIDEVERNKPEAVDFVELKQELTDKGIHKKSLENQISNKLEAQQEYLNQRGAIQREIHKVDSEINDIKHQLRQEAKEKFANSNSEITSVQSKINEITSEVQSSSNGLETLKSKLNSKNNELQAAQNKREELIRKWNEVNAKEFTMDEGDCKCPTCNREFDPETIDEKKAEAKERFDANKQQTLNSINIQGGGVKLTKENLEKEISDLEVRIDNGSNHIIDLELKRENLLNKSDELKSNQPNITEESIYTDLLNTNNEIDDKVKDLAILKQKLEEVKPVDISTLKFQKDNVQKEIDELKNQLSIEDQIVKSNARINVLEKEESELSQTIADYEREQFVIENFIKAKIDTLESMINERFELVNFKLFETQVNGAQVETCQALINGVPFSDANTASKINAGIDIINTLSKHYQVSAPIFVDNRESVVNLIPSQSQIINLIVSEADKKLRVKTNITQEAYA
ncbi:AAA family ATPase [Mesonia sp. K4-1]|uniref:AAA family ATPase n=1 Tax=Mesonia sp. K4-1 TaxID=2602760 RepID=UPI0011C8D10A|nr:AAA family ATPase [Mesonia sp. K4-1]TXK78717.1 AAA family ATPase [Mesonia sp. K4-1]